MAATRTVLLKTSLAPDVGVMALLMTTAGVIGALLMWWAARRTPANVPVRAARHFPHRAALAGSIAAGRIGFRPPEPGLAEQHPCLVYRSAFGLS